MKVSWNWSFLDTKLWNYCLTTLAAPLTLMPWGAGQNYPQLSFTPDIWKSAFLPNMNVFVCYKSSNQYNILLSSLGFNIFVKEVRQTRLGKKKKYILYPWYTVTVPNPLMIGTKWWDYFWLAPYFRVIQWHEKSLMSGKCLCSWNTLQVLISEP